MINRLKKIKLKHQLIILICLSISIIILLQVLYFIWFSNINKKNYSKFLDSTIDQLEKDSTAFLYDINNISNIISFNDITYQFLNNKDKYTELSYINSIQLMIDSIKLSNKSIDTLIYTNLDMINIGTYRQEDFWVLEKIKSKVKEGELQISQPTHLMIDDNEYGMPLYACINRSFGYQEGHSEFITVVIYNTKSFKSTVSSISSNHNLSFAILDSGDNTIASNRERFPFTKTELANHKRDIKDKKSSIKAAAGSTELLIHQRIVDGLNWRIVGVTPVNEIAEDLSALKQFGLLMGIIIIVLLSMIGLIISKSIATPITKMARFMNSMGQNYSTKRLVIKNANEIGMLAGVMNRMLDNIDVMTSKVITTQEKLYKVELAKKQAELSAFQSQMNPHFLYNTLDCVKSIAVARGVPEIMEISTSMAKILRYSIKDNNYVKVCNELDCIKDYLNIIQIRHRSRFTIIFELDEEIKDLTIPKMILQPVVENAVFHGLEQKAGQGKLVIHGFSSCGETIVFEVEDDGKGMSQGVLEQLEKKLAQSVSLGDELAPGEKKSIGLINIDSRIKLLYGNDYGLKITSTLDKGTKVIIELPIKFTNQNQSIESKNNTF